MCFCREVKLTQKNYWNLSAELIAEWKRFSHHVKWADCKENIRKITTQWWIGLGRFIEHSLSFLSFECVWMNNKQSQFKAWVDQTYAGRYCRCLQDALVRSYRTWAINGMDLTAHTYTQTPQRRRGGGGRVLIRTDIIKQYDVNITDKCIDCILGIQTNSQIFNVLHLFAISHQKIHHGVDMHLHFSHLLSKIYLNSETNAIFLMLITSNQGT